MQIRTLVFDVFGTVVDWRTSIIREVRAFGEGHGVAGDWADFADRWREGCTSGIARVNTGKMRGRRWTTFAISMGTSGGLRPWAPYGCSLSL